MKTEEEIMDNLVRARKELKVRLNNLLLNEESRNNYLKLQGFANCLEWVLREDDDGYWF